MGDERQIAYSEIAARNSKAAVKAAEDTRNELLDRIIHLEQLVATQGELINILDNKYNLLLTQRFSGGSTTVED